LRTIGAFSPKRPRNLLLALLACAALGAVYAGSRRLAPWSPKHGLGLACGVGAALVFAANAAHPLRHRLMRWIPTRPWLQAHIHLGLVAFCAVLVHSGFTWPEGGLGAALLGLSAWTALSGGLGVVLQKWIPARIADGLRVEALYERIPALREELVAKADALTEGAGEVLARFYRRDVRPLLARPQPSWAFLLDVRAGREQSLEPLRRTRAFVPPEDREKVEDLLTLYTEKLELDAHLSLQRTLRAWVVLHAPAAGLLLGLMTFHIWAWAWY
jgi:hypothetical protein